jgi:sulfate adenylyltransferase
MTQLIAPHGGKLVDLQASPSRVAELKAALVGMPSWDLTDRQMCDLELLMNGAFSPLEGFLGKADYESVRDDMRLKSGELWPMPITLDVPEAFAANLAPGKQVALRNVEGTPLAVLTITDLWTPDRELECKKVFGTTDRLHPGVAACLNGNPVYLGGRVEGLERPQHYTFKGDRFSPAELRELFAKRGWTKVVAFQTRNPLHRAHFEMTLRAAKESAANFVLNPVVGMTKPGDVSAYTRVRCYKALMARYPSQSSQLALLQLAMRMGGPREALWHAIIRKNHGINHFIVGRDHAGPGKDASGKDFYGPYEAQDLVKKHAPEIGMTILGFEQMVFVEERGEYMQVGDVPKGMRTLDISGTEQRRRLAQGIEIPEWFSFPEVVSELRKEYPPRSRQGFTLFFTGLSGSGKSTIANAVLAKLMELGTRPVTLLDGDVVRRNLSSELGFSKEHRDLNIRRIGYVASEITKNGGIAICAPIAPYDATRKAVRKEISQYGGFILVHLATPIEVCEGRDRKGLYAKARAGIVKEFTGISDPYEVPADAELVINTGENSIEESAQKIFLHLEKEGFIV